MPHLPHHRVQALASDAKKLYQKSAELFNHLNVGEAATALRKALAIYQALLAAGHSQYRANAAQTRMNLGIALSQSGQLSEAISQHQDALSDYQALIEAGHSQYRDDGALARMNLGIALSEAGQLSEAITQYGDALGAYQTLIDAGHSQYRGKAARTRMNLGIALSKAGQLSEAMTQYRDALGAYQALIEAGHSQYRADAAGTRNSLGNALADAGQLGEAMAQYRDALRDYQALIEAGHSQYRAAAAGMHMNLGRASSDAGQLREAMTQYQDALVDYQTLIDTGQSQYRASAADTRMNLGNALNHAGKLSEAMAQYRDALGDYQALIEAGHSQYRGKAARTRRNLGIALSQAGLLSDAMTQYQDALGAYQALIDAGQSHYSAEAAGTHMNLGVALNHAGKLSEAMTQYRDALGAYQALIDAGHSQYRAAAAGTRNSLGIALADAGQLGEAMAQYRDALGAYQTLIDAGHSQYRDNAAATRINLGNALMWAGQLSEAIAQHQNALSDYQALIDAGHNQYRADVADARMSLGIALSQAGQLSEAITQYRDALGAYQMLIDAGHSQYRDNAARTRMNLGHALSNAGQLSDAMAQYQSTTDTLRNLVDEGQRQYTEKLVEAANLLANETLDWALNAATSDGERSVDFDANLARAELEGALNQLTSLPLPSLDAQQLLALQTTWETVQRYWRARDAVQTLLPTLTNAVLPVCATWQEQAAELLTRGSPEFLQSEYELRIRPMLLAMLDLLLETGQASAVANWHLRTQGLRAQRQVVSAGSLTDDELKELDALYTQVEQLDREIHGQYRADMVGLSARRIDADFDSGAQRGGLRDSEQTTKTMQSRLHARKILWEEELQPLEQRLQAQGRLPSAHHLDLADLGEKLNHPVSREAMQVVLLMLIPVDEQSLAVVCVRGGGWETGQPNYQADLHRMTVPTGESALRDIAETLTQAATRGKQRYGAVRGDVGNADEQQALAATAGVLDESTLAALQTQWLTAPDVLRPLLTDLRSQGVDEVHIVPGGDLHLAPWAASLDQAVPGLRVRQFPTTASWWRVMGEPVDTPAPTRWASLAFDAANTQAELIWVNAEALALQQIWSHAGDDATPAMQPLNPVDPHWPPPDQRAAPVQALVGIGHGHAPEGNWALAGMVVGTDASKGAKNPRHRYFTGMDLHKIQDAKHIAMSCCVLGRVQDGQGEPIGMTALAFGFKARVALGSMVPVPDFEGALFSMAVHFAWAQAEQASLARGQHLDWSGVFHATRREVMTGRWPQGFGEWLLARLYRLATASGDGSDARRNQALEMAALQLGIANADVAGYVAQLAAAPSQAVLSVAAMFTCLG